jgi:hypothetical protein
LKANHEQWIKSVFFNPMPNTNWILQFKKAPFEIANFGKILHLNFDFQFCLIFFSNSKFVILKNNSPYDNSKLLKFWSLRNFLSARTFSLRTIFFIVHHSSFETSLANAWLLSNVDLKRIKFHEFDLLFCNPWIWNRTEFAMLGSQVRGHQNIQIHSASPIFKFEFFSLELLRHITVLQVFAAQQIQGQESGDRNQASNMVICLTALKSSFQSSPHNHSIWINDDFRKIHRNSPRR